MNNYLRKTKGSLLFILVIIFLGKGSILPNSLAAQEPVKVLWIFSWNKDFPWQKELERGFKQHISTTTQPITTYYEYMDDARFNTDEKRDIIGQYIRQKYADIPLDYIIYESEPASRYYLQNKDAFRAKQHIILNPESELTEKDKNLAVIPVELDYQKAISSLVSLTQGEKIYIVAGSDESTLKRVDMVTSIIRNNHPATEFETAVGIPVNNLINRFANHHQGGVILYLLVIEDAKGNQYIPYQIAKSLSENATIPVFSLWTSLLGSGVTGGYMLSGEKTGKIAAQAILNHQNFLKDSIGSNSFHDHYFDWRQLKRWKIAAHALPQDSHILFQKPNFFKAYYKELIALIFIISVLVLWLRNSQLKRFSLKLRRTHKKLRKANKALVSAQHELQAQNQKLTELSTKDSLTGIYNRSHLDQVIESEVMRSNRYKSNLSLIMLDIDHFKNINDNYGHQVGDAVLIRVAEVLNQNLRTTDILARWGGEEFMILCPNSSESQTLIVAQKLRKNLASVKHKNVGQVTASFGVASHQPGQTVRKLVNQADEALYKSKSAGRNCVSASGFETKFAV